MTPQRLNELRRLADFMKGVAGPANQIAELIEHIDELQRYKDTVDALEANRHRINNIEGPESDPEDHWTICADDDGPTYSNGRTFARGKTLQEAVLDMLGNHAQISDDQ